MRLWHLLLRHVPKSDNPENLIILKILVQTTARRQSTKSTPEKSRIATYFDTSDLRGKIKIASETARPWNLGVDRILRLPRAVFVLFAGAAFLGCCLSGAAGFAFFSGCLSCDTGFVFFSGGLSAEASLGLFSGGLSGVAGFGFP